MPKLDNWVQLECITKRSNNLCEFTQPLIDIHSCSTLLFQRNSDRNYWRILLLLLTSRPEFWTKKRNRKMSTIYNRCSVLQLKKHQLKSCTYVNNIDICLSWNFPAWVKLSYVWALQFSSWNRADKRSNVLTLIKYVVQIFQFCACTIMITTNSY